MTLRLHNSLSGRKEEFQPLESGVVRMYTCGPTVWNSAHIGNMRSFLLYDLIRRHLRTSGYELRHVMNLTDVDDRIIEQSDEAGITIAEFTPRWEESVLNDLKRLRAQPAEWYPRATDHVPEMVRLISRLLELGHAYQMDGDVYFRIDSFPAYGALSKLDWPRQKPAARVATDRYGKESAADFALWKGASERDHRVGAAWEAPFGTGRPGWHIECSAMASRYLGETLDIHAGGVDLLFPHHENEIAQSEAGNRKPFSRYWLHGEHLTVASGEKMSKSSGNFLTLNDFLAAGHDQVSIRFHLMAGAHYRQRTHLSDGTIRAAAEQVRRLRELEQRLHLLNPRPGLDDAAIYETALDGLDAYREALDDDLNLALAVGHLFEVVRAANSALDAGRVGTAGREALQQLLEAADAHLDVLRTGEESLDEEVEKLIEQREEARRRRDFATSDRIRDELRGRGLVLEDSREGVRWKRVPAGG